MDAAARFAALKAKLSGSTPAPAPVIQAKDIFLDTPTAPTVVSIPLPPKPIIPSRLPYDLLEKVLSLESALLEKHPRMPTLLREIHTTLRQQPENVTLMNEEEIAIIVSGLSLQTQTQFVASATKGPGKTNQIARIKQLGLDAF